MLKLLMVFVCAFTTSICFCQPAVNTTLALNKDSLINSTKKIPVILSLKPGLKIYPNPARNKITLLVSGFRPGMVIVKILDEKGNLQSKDNRLLTSNEEEIMMFLQLRTGIYFVFISQQNKTVKNKLMVY